MRRPKADRYDYGFHLIGVLFTFMFLVATKDCGWSISARLIVLVIVSIPVGLGLGWLKGRLQSRPRRPR